MNSVCKQLHHIVHRLKRHRYPFDVSELPKNGLYLLFEEGETGHDGERIVRIGTHTGENQLRSRIKQHFIKEKKDRSIFRKNIGRALLHQNNDPFLEAWNIDLTSRASKAMHASSIDFDKQATIEQSVSTLIRETMSFCVLQIESKALRLQTESRIISTVSLCEHCAPSKNWLGLQSPVKKIAESGLWQVNELYKQPLSTQELNQLEHEFLY